VANLDRARATIGGFGCWKTGSSEDGDALTVDLGTWQFASARVSVTPFAAEEPLHAGIGEPLRKA